MIPKTILVVDDAVMERMKISVAVKKLGHNTVEAKDGQEAIDVAATSQIDLILLDLLMPEMDGFETLKHLKAKPDTSSIPVVVVSSIDGEDDIKRAIDLGALSHLGKPTTLDALKEALSILG
jgi:CheY-like chemotaxis protein